MTNDDQYIPGFHFKVSFINFEKVDIEARFSEVSGLQMEMETEEIRGGGENHYVYRLPKGAKNTNLTLKRALHADYSHIVKWAENAIHNFEFRLYDVEVSLLNPKGEPLKTWSFIGAYPVKIQISDLNANNNSLVIESLELAYKYSRPVSLKDLNGEPANSI